MIRIITLAYVQEEVLKITLQFLKRNYFQTVNSHPELPAVGQPHNFSPGLTLYGTQSASQFGAQMYGYGTNFSNKEMQQFYVNQNQEDFSRKRKREDIDGDEMGECY